MSQKIDLLTETMTWLKTHSKMLSMMILFLLKIDRKITSEIVFEKE